MKIVIDRKYPKETYTIGRIYIDGVMICNSLEDKDRGLLQSMSVSEIKKKKVYGETAIPKGTYDVEVTWSPKFKRDLPLIKNVKGFDGIRLHSGTSATDSLGCILCGMNTIKGKVTQSRYYENKIVCMLLEAQIRGEKIVMEIK